jgi:exodeoxyribonuclease X
MKIAVVDTETTGLEPETASILELGVVTIPGFDTYSSIVKPGHPIELAAMAAHHITEEEAAKGIQFKDAIKKSKIEKADVIAAHNAAFDMGFLKIDKPVICTWRCAQHLWHDAPAYGNQVIRYFLRIEDELHNGDGAKIMKLPPHRALPDAWVTAHILHKMLIKHSPEQLVELTKAPILLKMCRFGKHRGAEWKDVPRDYMLWMLKQQPGFDSDTVFTIKTQLGMV